MSNHHKIIILLGAIYMKDFFRKKSFLWGANLFGQKIYEEVSLKGRTNNPQGGG